MSFLLYTGNWRPEERFHRDASPGTPRPWATLPPAQRTRQAKSRDKSRGRKAPRQVVEATVEHVTDMQAIMAAGVLSTLAVAVDGVIKLKGRVPTADEVRQWIAG